MRGGILYYALGNPMASSNAHACQAIIAFMSDSKQMHVKRINQNV